MNEKSLTIPITEEQIRELRLGDTVLLHGLMLTGRDAAHKWLVDTFLRGANYPSERDQAIYQEIRPILNGGVIYHCGPVVAGLATSEYRFIAAGPTTSIREEPYQGEVMRHFNIRGVIGKGGMGRKTLQACAEVPGVYFHAIGGAAALIAEKVQEVLAVYKLEFGPPEALWAIRVKDFPVVVTMDAHGNSLHEMVRQRSQVALEKLLGLNPGSSKSEGR